MSEAPRRRGRPRKNPIPSDSRKGSYYDIYKAPSFMSQTWTKEEDREILQYAEKSNKNWFSAPSYFHTVGKRTPFDYSRRYNYLTQVKNQWTPLEDDKLVQLVSQFGDHNWQAVSKSLPGHTAKQCCIRYSGLLASQATEPWTEEEDQIIYNLYSNYGNQYAKYISELPGRTLDEIKVHTMNLIQQSPSDTINTSNDEEEILDVLSETKSLPQITSNSPHKTFLKLDEKPDVYQRAVKAVSYYNSKYLEDERKRNEKLINYELNNYHLKKIEKLLQDKNGKTFKSNNNNNNRYNNPNEISPRYYYNNEYYDGNNPNDFQQNQFNNYSPKLQYSQQPPSQQQQQMHFHSNNNPLSSTLSPSPYYINNDMMMMNDDYNNINISPRLSPKTSPRLLRSRTPSPRPVDRYNIIDDMDDTANNNNILLSNTTSNSTAGNNNGYYYYNGVLYNDISPRYSPRYNSPRLISPRLLDSMTPSYNDYLITNINNEISPRLLDGNNSSNIDNTFGLSDLTTTITNTSSSNISPKYNNNNYEYLPSPNISPRSATLGNIETPMSSLSEGSLKNFWQEMDDNDNKKVNQQQQQLPPPPPPQSQRNTPLLTPTAYQLRTLQSQNISDKERTDMKKQIFSSPTNGKTEELRNICALERSGAITHEEAENRKKLLYTR